MIYLYQVWCEWDIGQVDKAFTSKEVAKKWVQDNTIMQGILEENDVFLEDYWDVHIGISTLELVN